MRVVPPVSVQGPQSHHARNDDALDVHAVDINDTILIIIDLDLLRYECAAGGCLLGPFDLR